MSLLGDIFGTSGAERGLYDLSKLYGNLAKSNLPRGVQLLWKIINATGLTPGMQAQQSMYDSDLLAGYQRALGATLQGNQARGLSSSLLDLNTRQALARGYAGERARYAAGLVGQSEAEKKQMLQLLLQLASGFGGQAMQGYSSAAGIAQSNWSTLSGLVSAFAPYGFRSAGASKTPATNTTAWAGGTLGTAAPGAADDGVPVVVYG